MKTLFYICRFLLDGYISATESEADLCLFVSVWLPIRYFGSTLYLCFPCSSHKHKSGVEWKWFSEPMLLWSTVSFTEQQWHSKWSSLFPRHRIEKWNICPFVWFSSDRGSSGTKCRRVTWQHRLSCSFVASCYKASQTCEVVGSSVTE